VFVCREVGLHREIDCGRISAQRGVVESLMTLGVHGFISLGVRLVGFGVKGI